MAGRARTQVLRIAHGVAVIAACTTSLRHFARAADPIPPIATPVPETMPRVTATTDTTYGRIEGDLTLVVGAGVTVAPRGVRAAADLRLRYLDTVGAFVAYEDGVLLGSGSDPRRLVATGLEVRPLFLARWLKGKESGNARADLILDSLGLEVGALFAQPIGAAFASRPGLHVGLGVELPVFPTASGPWIGLRGGLRWSDGATSLGVAEGPLDRAAFLSITLAWHQVFGAHVVDVSDRAVR